MNHNPIGVFDSGIGGLSTLRELRRQLPQEHFLYVADLAWSPYGNKPVTLLQDRAAHITDFLLQRQAKAIVIACNTATAAAIHQLRERYTLPIIGVEPGIKPAITRTLSGVVGILATQRTIDSEKFRKLVSQFSTDTKIVAQPCPGLAEAIDEGPHQTALRAQLLRHFIAPLLARGADTLVLGCTHYPLIMAEIRQTLAELGHGQDSKRVELIDTSEAIARQVVRQLEQNHSLNADSASGTVQFFSTDITTAENPAQRARSLSEVFSYYWGEAINVTAFPD
ncbi:MAG: glutamate racemase [Pseudomonadota bacterium]